MVQNAAVGGERSTSPIRSGRWRLRHSLWMLPAILGFGLFTWISFLYIGVRAKRSGWLAAAGAYFAGMVAVFVIDGLGGEGSVLNSISGVLMVAMWLGGTVHALVSNRNWLRWHASADATPWYLADDPTDPYRKVDLYVPGYDEVAYDPALEAVRSLSASPLQSLEAPAADAPAAAAPPPPPPPPPPVPELSC